MNVIQQLEKESLRKDIVSFNPGDTIRVYVKTFEGGKERLQPFEGVVIKKSCGKGFRSSFTVRKVTQGVGIERTFQIHSPVISKIVVNKKGMSRRAKLFYLRERKGSKESRIKSADDK
jgi:large subunit ribosomal protein L19